MITTTITLANKITPKRAAAATAAIAATKAAATIMNATIGYTKNATDDDNDDI